MTGVRTHTVPARALSTNPSYLSSMPSPSRRTRASRAFSSTASTNPSSVIWPRIFASGPRTAASRTMKWLVPMSHGVQTSVPLSFTRLTSQENVKRRSGGVLLCVS